MKQNASLSFKQSNIGGSNNFLPFLGGEKPVKESENSVEEDKEAVSVDACVERLQKIFMAYCPIGANSNTNKMPCFKFVAMLKDCGLLQIALTKGRIKSGKLFCFVSMHRNSTVI